jgi:8-oxo-dGTP pyrophosphatase MutT (NUDIX family)
LDTATALLAIQTTVILAGSIVAIFQIRQATAVRRLAALQEIFREFHEKDAYITRNMILRGSLSTSGAEADDEAFFTLMSYSDFFQRLGFLSRHRFLPRKHVLQMYSATIMSMWDALEPFIRHVRSERSISNYAHDFESLKDDAVRFRTKLGTPEVALARMRRADDPFARHYAGVLLRDTQARFVLHGRSRGATREISTFGGVVEHGEPPVDAAVRELQEEARLDVPSSRLALIGTYAKVERDGSLTLCWYFLTDEPSQGSAQLSEDEFIERLTPSSALSDPRVTLAARTAIALVLNASK